VHPFRVIQGLNENVILGADFINKHLLVYDPKFKQVRWRKDNSWSVSSVKMTHETVIPEYSSKLVKVKTDNGTEDTEQVVAITEVVSFPFSPKILGILLCYTSKEICDAFSCY